VLGAMKATAELKELYPTLESEDTRETAIEAFAHAGETAVLKEILESERNPELRETAIEGIAMVGGDEAGPYLESMYNSAPSQDEKSMILEALVILDHDAVPLALKILRNETDPELQSDAIEVLGDLEATEELSSLYANLTSNEARETVLESLAKADDSAGVIRILETERDPELRAVAIEALATIDDPETTEYLLNLYPQGSEDEKIAVIEAMLIQDNVQGLIGLMKQENNPEMKKEMLEALSHMDSEESDEYLFDLLENKG